MSTSDELLQKATRLGVELHLWAGKIAWIKTAKVPTTLREEIAEKAEGVARLLIRKINCERHKEGAEHRWVLKLGTPTNLKNPTPAYLACGSAEWGQRMIQQAIYFAENDLERSRWKLLEPNDVGLFARNDKGVLVANHLKLPSGVVLGGPKGSKAEVLSACETCLLVSPEDVKKIVKEEV